MADFLRLRRLRKSPWIRTILEETKLDLNDIIAPLFVKHGRTENIESMPEIKRFSMNDLLKEVESYIKLGIKSVLLFGIPASKDNTGSEAFSEKGIVQMTLKALKKNFPDVIAIADACLCQYTSHGHCGIVVNSHVDNDKTLDVLRKVAVSLAEAGADIIAPSGMMDGQVITIREALDSAGFKNTLIMAYSAKFASALYGPFREAAESAPQFGDRKGYQMNPANLKEAIREIEEDIKEGADIVMVKPAIFYLDVIRETKNRFSTPVAAYNVSGEYTMVKMSSNFLNEEDVMMEMLISIKRAGADIIITYFAEKIAKMLEGR